MILAADGIQNLLGAQRAAFLRDPYPSEDQRRKHLQSLIDVILSGKEEIAKAISQDFGGRARQEVMFSEVFVCLASLKHAKSQVREWMRPRRAVVDLALQPAKAWVIPQPLGTIGIIAPWNYPLFLSIGPLAGVLAAGNRALLKLSEYTPATSELIAQWIASVFSPDHVAVVNGDASVGREFAALPFDHLLFTGSTSVGREVMRAASANLTPVTLELGGKSPAIVASDADIHRTAADIMYGKLLNAGQTCIAPDYVFVPRAKLNAFADAALRAVEQYFSGVPDNPDYTAIIHEKHVSRLEGYLAEARAAGVEIRPEQPAPRVGRKIAPVLLIDPPDRLRVMEEEIFGPILPLKPYDRLEEAIAYINARPRPLAVYLFTKDRRVMEVVEQRTMSGALSVNETLVHCATEDLPFGGVGASGMGHYHGKFGFETFSKMKPVFYRPFGSPSAKLRPPYGAFHERMRKLLIR